MKGYEVPDGYMGFVDGKYRIFESEAAYFEFIESREDEDDVHRCEQRRCS